MFIPTDQPEAPLADVARGDFAGVSLPIFVACSTERELREFLDQYAFERREIRRYPHEFPARIPFGPGKILVKLPGWEHSHSTVKAVEKWAKEDRFTVDLDSVSFDYWRHRSVRPSAMGYVAFAALCGLAAWWISTL